MNRKQKGYSPYIHKDLSNAKTGGIIGNILMTKWMHLNGASGCREMGRPLIR